MQYGARHLGPRVSHSRRDAAKALRDAIKAARTVRALEIGREVATANGRHIDEILSPSRARPLPQIRWEIWYRCKHELGLGRSVIGKLFNRDKQTVYHGIIRAEQLKRADLSPLH